MQADTGRYSSRLPKAWGQEMEGNGLEEIAKEAYVIANQIGGMEIVMRSKEALSGYPTYASNFNAFLKRTKEILQADQTILGTISHLEPYDPKKDHGYARAFEEIKANLPVSQGALRSFFEFHFPKSEKERIGFNREDCSS
jgi:hypothetical protein